MPRNMVRRKILQVEELTYASRARDGESIVQVRSLVCGDLRVVETFISARGELRQVLRDSSILVRRASKLVEL
jgi:hypothetical protein